MKPHNHVTVIALVFVLRLAQMAVRENVKDVKVVVKTVVRPLVEVNVVKDVRDVVMQCVKVIASLDARLPATAYVEDRV